MVGILAMGMWMGSPAPSQTVIPVTDINPGSARSSPSYLTVFDDALFFRANDSPHGTNTELWRFDGTLAEIAAEIRPGAEGSLPSYLTVHDGMLYLSAMGPTGKTGLWRFDGSSASPVPDPLGWKPGNPQELFSFGGVLYFRAFASHIGIELYKFDGTRIEALDLFSGSGSSYPQHFIEFNGNLYFNAGATPGEGTELYRLDNGWKATKVTSINPGGASPENLAVHNGALYFSAYEPDHGRELWRYDGYAVELVADIVPGPSSSNPSGMTSYGNGLYFSADNGIDGAELWRYDGEAAVMVANINPTPFVPGIDPVHHSWPGDFFVFHDVLYFSADDGVHGREPWMYDGVQARLLRDVHPGPYGSYPGNFVVFRNQLYFTADDGVTGGELGGMVVLQLVEEKKVAFRRGDVDGSGKLNISDVIGFLNYMFLGAGVEPDCLDAADTDDSGTLDVSDAVYSLNFQFTGTVKELAPPGSRQCGPDVNEDDLPPCEYPAEVCE